VLVAGDSLVKDRDVLLNLKSFLEETNRVNQGGYSKWNRDSPESPCNWPEIICSSNNASTRVTGIKLPNSQIAGEMFGNFSLLSELSYLDLSSNTIGGMIPEDLSLCRNLVYLNLSHNILRGELNLPGLKNLVVL
jgi:Leucine-rich repeat (LRR) protein